MKQSYRRGTSAIGLVVLDCRKGPLDVDAGDRHGLVFYALVRVCMQVGNARMLD